jgi:hypothetical protein
VLLVRLSQPDGGARRPLAAGGLERFTAALGLERYAIYLHDYVVGLFEDQAAGHWALETHLDEIAGLMRDFLTRVHA